METSTLMAQFNWSPLKNIFQFRMPPEKPLLRVFTEELKSKTWVYVWFPFLGMPGLTFRMDEIDLFWGSGTWSFGPCLAYILGEKYGLEKNDVTEISPNQRLLHIAVAGLRRYVVRSIEDGKDIVHSARFKNLERALDHLNVVS